LDLNDEDESYEILNEEKIEKSVENKHKKIENFKNKSYNLANKKHEEIEFNFEDFNKSKPKKNNFKIQNGWIYQSDFKNY